ncbi:hypothetical protein AWC38_SpisGene6592 [Stylophora pistillata]|uniref:Uncharacterized protein n=1 Tax=Stylophora pistillata TaxID=50429 RepID=A0A2B4SHV0_STYPI|nr:hypothetical protein AWC38_SpisGene6592 [Stylophora pistillata]
MFRALVSRMADESSSPSQGRERSTSHTTTEQHKSFNVDDLLRDTDPQVYQRCDLGEQAPQQPPAKKGAKSRAVSKSKASTANPTTLESTSKGKQESRQEKSQIVNTLNSVNESIAAMTSQTADDTSMSESEPENSEPEDNPPKRQRTSDNSDAVEDGIANLLLVGESTVEKHNEENSFLNKVVNEFNDDTTGQTLIQSWRPSLTGL